MTSRPVEMTRASERGALLPSSRARSAWRGGVGRGVRLTARRLSPPPDPPTASRREGGARRYGTQFHQRRQKTRQRLAGAGRRDQQRRAIVAGFCQQRELMLARRPAARGEPLSETVRQQLGRRSACLGATTATGRLSHAVRGQAQATRPLTRRCRRSRLTPSPACRKYPSPCR